MPKRINNPHDKFVKDMFSDMEMAIAFLDTYLPDHLKKILVLQSLEYENTSYLTDELAETFSDIVIKFNTVNDDLCQISLLIEHKSSPDPLIAFQLAGYISMGYLKQIKQKK